MGTGVVSVSNINQRTNSRSVGSEGENGKGGRVSVGAMAAVRGLEAEARFTSK
jgi:hypothetical protein